jgi:uncharacterized membrane protein YhaH (DUF805 family)
MFNLKDYLSSKGRINRSTWWISMIIVYAVGRALGYMLSVGYEGVTFFYGSKIALLGSIISLIPILYNIMAFGAICTVSAKRLHDTNKSAWYLLLGLIPILGTLILLVICGFEKGTKGPNRFDSDSVISDTPAGEIELEQVSSLHE